MDRGFYQNSLTGFNINTLFGNCPSGSFSSRLRSIVWVSELAIDTLFHPYPESINDFDPDLNAFAFQNTFKINLYGGLVCETIGTRHRIEHYCSVRLYSCCCGKILYGLMITLITI